MYFVFVFECELLCVACCRLICARCSLFVARCWLFVVCCLLYVVVYWLLFGDAVACSLLIVALLLTEGVVVAG